jgi:hypothetical protein
MPDRHGRDEGDVRSLFDSLSPCLFIRGWPLRVIVFSLIARANRRMRGVEFCGGKCAIAVLVEGLERIGCLLELGCRDRSILIDIQCRDHGWDRRLSWRAFGLLLSIRRRRHAEFVGGDFSITVMVQFPEGFSCGLDLFS